MRDHLSCIIKYVCTIVLLNFLIGLENIGSFNDNPLLNSPVKTVKELIAFYYYWKRKGAASALNLTYANGGLNTAAANFAAAVAAASASIVPSSNSAVYQPVGGLSINPFLANQISNLVTNQSGGKKRKTSRGFARKFIALLSFLFFIILIICFS